MTARTFSPNPFATLTCAAVGALLLVGQAAALVDAGPQLRFSALPKQVVQGRPAAVTVSAARASRCTLAVRYGDGKLQGGLGAVRATNGRARWQWEVPGTAATGPAKVVAACGSSRATAALPVVAGAKVPGVTITQQGYSQRYRFGRSSVSYGVVLTNTSAERDALNVVVLVNFVDATNTVLGTSEQRVAGIAARAPFYVGGFSSLPPVDVARLEVTFRVGERAPRAIHEPSFADLRLRPAIDPAFLGAVEGQVLNDKGGTVLKRSGFSAVFFDAAGEVIGGAEGNLRSALPEGVREHFSISRGADSVLLARTAEAKISAEPFYEIKP